MESQPRFDARAVSRAELARRTALAPSTVSAVVSDLQTAGLVVEPPAPPRDGGAALGRPPVLVALHRRAGVALGIDFGKRHVRVALSDLSHTLLAERHRALDADEPAPEAIALAVSLVDEVLTEAGASRGEIVGVGMGLPGPVHQPSGELGDSTILPGWVGVRAASAMSDALGHSVEVQNDANLGALSEWMWGAGRDADHMAYRRRLRPPRSPVRGRRRDGGGDRPHGDRPGRPNLPLRQPRLPGDAGGLERRARLAARHAGR